jgi:hypothetical protein
MSSLPFSKLNEICNFTVNLGLVLKATFVDLVLMYGRFEREVCHPNKIVFLILYFFKPYLMQL